MNRSLEAVIAVGHEFSSVEALWSQFEGVMGKDATSAAAPTTTNEGGGGGNAAEKEANKEEEEEGQGRIKTEERDEDETMTG